MKNEVKKKTKKTKKMITQRIKTDTSTVENMLNYCSVKQKVLSQNVANVGTENYKRKDVSFRNLLEGNSNEIMKQSNPKHFPLNSEVNEMGGFEIVEENSNEFSSGVNNIDIDKEMTEMAENQIRYKFAAKRISGYYKNLQAAIKGSF